MKLAHVRSQYWRAALMAAAVFCLAFAAAGSSFTTAVPAPTGPNHVGTLLLRLVDPQRNDPYLANRGKRELLIRFWYPASISQGCKPAEYTSPKVILFGHRVRVACVRFPIGVVRCFSPGIDIWHQHGICLQSECKRSLEVFRDFREPLPGIASDCF